MYSNELILKILDFIDSNINRKITMNELQELFYYNKDYIMRLFKKELNVTIFDYINKKRIYDSLNDLRNYDYLMTRVALLHGFTSQEYFSEIFTKIMGVNPLTYRKSFKIGTTFSDDDLNIIRTNSIDLKLFFDKIDAYKRNISTTEKKTLSFFH